jgi:hypothetical protein
VERKKLTTSEKVKIISEVEENPTVSQNEIVNCFVLPLLSFSNIILQILEEEVGIGHILRNEQTFRFLNEQDSVSYY